MKVAAIGYNLSIRRLCTPTGQIVFTQPIREHLMPIPNPPQLPIILGSSSPTRRIVLEKLRIPFRVVKPSTDETPLPGEAPASLALRLAIEKANDVALTNPEHLIIASDQVAVVRGEMVGKPKDREDAIRQLTAASGQSIILHTGLVLLNSETGMEQAQVVDYRVEFRELTRKAIERYIDLDQPYDCGGSLRSESLGIALLKRFDGDDPNALLGLPLIRLVDMLAREGVHPLDEQISDPGH